MEVKRTQTQDMCSISTDISSGYAGMVCLDVYHNENMSWGYIYSPFKQEPIKYFDYGDLLIKLNDLFDELGYPMSSVECRSFSKDTKGHPKSKLTLYHDLKSYNLYELERNQTDGIQQEKSYSSTAKKRNTFMLHVLYRQHASLQGIIYWSDKKSSFRSGIELLILIKSTFEPKNNKQITKKYDVEALS